MTSASLYFDRAWTAIGRVAVPSRTCEPSVAPPCSYRDPTEDRRHGTYRGGTFAGCSTAHSAIEWSRCLTVDDIARVSSAHQSVQEYTTIRHRSGLLPAMVRRRWLQSR